MPSPCRKCGATKTEPVRRGIMRHSTRLFGYRLRECSRCRRWRILPERIFRRDGLYSGAAGENETANFGFDPDGFDGCPRCGKKEFDRVPRNWMERVWRWAPMARCRKCGKRFTYPQH